MASITKYETKDGTFYRCSIYAGIDPDTGKQKNIAKRGFKTKKAANAWADKTRAAIANGEKKASLKAKTMTFHELYEDWFEQYKLGVKPSTAIKTAEIFRLHILPTFGHKRLQALTTDDIQSAVNAWAENDTRFKTMYNYTNRLLEYGAWRGFIADNPAKGISMPKKIKRVQKDENFWTKDELNIFLKECKKDKRKDVYPFFRLLAYTGMRRGEILALEWTDLDEDILSVNKAISRDENGNAIISTPKTKSSVRTIVLDKETARIMKWYHAINNGKYIFGGNKPIPDSLPRKWLVSIAKRAGLRPISIHGFRHTHCSLLFESGATPKEVQERLGHSSSEITLNIYTHISERQKTSTPNRLAEYLSDDE